MSHWFAKWRNRHQPAVAPYPTLQTERLVLRAFEPSDAVDVFNYAQSPVVGPMAGWPPHRSMEDTVAVVRGFIAHGDVWAVVEKKTGHVIGTVGLHIDPKRGVEGARMLGYVLGEASWGQGYATEAARAAVRFAFEELKCPVLAVYHFPTNPKSKHVIKKLGFTYEGTLRSATTLPDGSVTDDVCYSMTREEYEARRAEGDNVKASAKAGKASSK